jgi:hypothetical protein
MTDTEDYPLMTVGELARALSVPGEFVYTHAAEPGAICLRLPDNNGKYIPRNLNVEVLRFPRSAQFSSDRRSGLFRATATQTVLGVSEAGRG